jgi:hypothetical protein
MASADKHLNEAREHGPNEADIPVSSGLGCMRNPGFRKQVGFPSCFLISPMLMLYLTPNSARRA